MELAAAYSGMQSRRHHLARVPLRRISQTKGKWLLPGGFAKPQLAAEPSPLGKDGESLLRLPTKDFRFWGLHEASPLFEAM
jgi:hypothetical protein